jgi:DNA-binding beta-propeller fold protein YncE
MPTYKGAFYGIDKPLGVAVSADGAHIYATQSGSKAAVISFDRDGTKLGQLEFPSESGSIHAPVYLTFAPSGDLYVGDRAAGAIYIFDAAGTYKSTFTPKDSSVHVSPLGVAVGADGSVYVANVLSNTAAEHCILVFDADGNLTGTYGKGQLSYPNQLALDAAGNLYATDSNHGRLVVFEPGGKQTTLVAHGVGEGDLGLPRGLGIDDQGRIYVVDTTDHMVRTYRKADTATGAPPFAGSFGEQGIEDGRFMYPNGLAVDGRARVYVADRENNRIQVWGF